METVIVGGGIGGLATAAFLQHSGHRVHVYEQTSVFREVGAGLVLAPNAVRLLRRIGLADALERSATKIRTGWEFRRWQDGQVLFAQDMAECERMYGEAAWLVHRADLHEILIAAVAPSSIHLGYRCVDVKQSETGVRCTFDGNRTVDSELLVAADGIHSQVRRTLVGDIPVRDSGLCAWRASVPRESLPERYFEPVQRLWLGPGRHLVHYPISNGRLVNIVAFTPAGPGRTVESWTTEGDPVEFREAFDGWHSMVTELLDSVRTVGRWSVFDRDPIERYNYGRIALVGDSAHPMLPFFAQGAGQAIEDAAALSTCMEEVVDTEAALGAYSRVRVPRTAAVQRASHGRATINHLADGPAQKSRDDAFRIGDPLADSAWLYGYDAQLEARDGIVRGSLKLPGILP
ncbi:FAD-dependent monooxygenase [Rhodococcus qingshengii]|uniref:FAD-dependent monooxygenase n=1 Tax=Rhodococcus qingshengii TaxID=334542 RepID=UPI001BEA58FE|nr:FAD-dependent monooxygenase [Rhodococcus qingshengii]MBT2269953.1 FAD-dependent monooxygenase [Rhodococcus qingshengii]